MKKLNMSQSQGGENRKRKRPARKIFRLSIPFLIFILFFGCTRRDKAPVCVTYEVSINSDTPYSVFIAYRDSTGYVTLYAEEDWSMQVSLPRRSIASLLVISQKDLDVDLKDMDYLHSLRTRRHDFFATIIEGESVVSDSSNDVVSISIITSD